ncbi:6-phospho-3-hexuloisomerase [Planomicrobium sp. CPCC 101079]|uniref:6-phospho-3-hexuloisomerase n=1 Tax=Planomicrobium sp. CPCC 101079 TaxID=2599618 RepID=UPI0011B5B10D|nr:6-phospho-3-hexuloisomerase [Planomicrobium sp. CPCC 101079]TWT01105.1 6-phospho-3-hexuloisomerase [Planomicrobium sp. CPCC 101079]
MQTAGYTEVILKELQTVLSSIEDSEADKMVEALLASKKIFVAGGGRSGFMAKSFVMRLMHIGLDPYIVGETVTPNLDADDIFVVASGSGETQSFVAMTEKARKIGAIVAAVTINPDSTIGKLGDIVVEIPAQAKAEGDSGKSIQPMGSLFEQSLLLFFDAVILKIMEKKSLTSQTMYGRHANLE